MYRLAKIFTDHCEHSPDWAVGHFGDGHAALEMQIAEVDHVDDVGLLAARPLGNVGQPFLEVTPERRSDSRLRGNLEVLRPAAGPDLRLNFLVEFDGGFHAGSLCGG
jgi:hypothetical protein